MKDVLLLARNAASRTIEFCMAADWKHVKKFRDQILRSAFSVPSNIAEGIGRCMGISDTAGEKSKKHFYRIAYGSLKECFIQLELMKTAKPRHSTAIDELLNLWMTVEDSLAVLVGAPTPNRNELICWTFVREDSNGDRIYERPCDHSGNCFGSCHFGKPCLNKERMVLDSHGVLWFFECENCWHFPDPEVFFTETPSPMALEGVERRRKEYELRKIEHDKSVAKKLGIEYP